MNEVTYHSIVKACLKNEQWDDAIKYVQMMKSKVKEKNKEAIVVCFCVCVFTFFMLFKGLSTDDTFWYTMMIEVVGRRQTLGDAIKYNRNTFLMNFPLTR